MQGDIYPTVPIKSPIGDYVHLINVNIGEFADTQMGRKQVMFEVTNNSRLHADFRVYEKDIYKVKKGQKVYFTVANHPGKILEASIYSVGQAFEEEQKSIHLHAQIDNPGGVLLPGMYLEGKIAIDNTPVLAVPDDAIVTEGDLAFKFIKAAESEEGDRNNVETEAEGVQVHENNKYSEGGEKFTFKKVRIITGTRDGGYVEIKLFDPLPKGTMVVIKGAYILSSEMIKEELEHEH